MKRAQRVNGHVDYDVEFDRAFEPSMDLTHFGIERGHGWSCLEEHLDKEGSEEEDEDHKTKKHEKEEEIIMAKRIDWVSADFIIKRMMAEGKTQEEIAKKVGCSKKSIANRVEILKRMSGDTSAAEITEDEEGKKAELNDLEEALAAVMSEQKEEIDYLQGRVRGLEMEVEARTEEAMEAKRLAVKKEDRIRELECELEGTVDALGVVESSLDEERRAKELLAKELSAAREAVEAKEAAFMSGIHETLARYDARIKEISEERDRYLRLAIRLSESVVGL